MFWRDRLLMAQRFDADGVPLTGDAIVVAQDVAHDPNEQMLATVSSTGRPVYLPGGSDERSSLYRLDRPPYSAPSRDPP